MADIIVLAENTKGQDKAIGDVHGGLTTFKEWLATIGPDDRGICVGDFVDRGEEKGSVGVIEAIVRHNEDPTKGKIHAVRGNHETICLKAIHALLDHAELLSAYSSFLYADDNTRDILSQHLQGVLSTFPAVVTQLLGDQALMNSILSTPEDNLFMSEPDNAPFHENYILQRMIEKIASSEIDAEVLMEKIVASNSDLNFAVNYYSQQWLVGQFMDEVNISIQFDDNTRIITFSDDSRFNLVRNYMEQLPYIIYVDGVQPYVIGHADLSFIGDQELRKRALRNMPLSEEERDHVTFARKNAEGDYVSETYDQRFPQQRTPNSTLSIVGHNIVDGLDSCVIRANTNTADLDVMSWYYKAILSLNVTRAVPEWIGVDIHPQPTVNNEVDTLDRHMLDVRETKFFLEELKTCQSLDDVEKTIRDFDSEFITAEHLHDITLNHNGLSEALILSEINAGNLSRLLDFGLDPDYTFVQDNRVSNLALFCIETGKADDLRLLLANIPDPHLLSVYPNGVSLYDAALQSKNSAMVRIVAEAHLFHAISKGNPDMMLDALKKGASIYQKSIGGQSALEYAKEHGCIKDLLTSSQKNMAAKAYSSNNTFASPRTAPEPPQDIKGQDISPRGK